MYYVHVLLGLRRGPRLRKLPKNSLLPLIMIANKPRYIPISENVSKFSLNSEFLISEPIATSVHII